MPQNRTWMRTVLPLVLVAVLATFAAACPTCKEGLAEHDPQGQSVAAGYYYSILFMMSMPYLVLGTFGSLAYFSIRRAREREAAETVNAVSPRGDDKAN